MEWYVGNVIEDLVVPNNEEILDRLPSPDSWSSWDKLVGTFNSPKKLMTVLSETMFPSDVEQYSSPSVRQGSRHASRQQSASYPRQHSDIQLVDDLSIFDVADDNFFHSLFEADTTTIDEAVHSTNFLQSSSKDDLKQAVDLVGGRNHIQDNTNIFENVSHYPSAKEPEFEMCISEEHTNIGEEDISMEESALLDLQRLTVQLEKKTRICFRDSFYRLSENSRHEADFIQNGKENQLENCKPTTSSAPFRLQESEAKIPDKKVIDRTVATLLFDTIKCCNLDATPISDLSFVTPPQREYEGKSNLYQPNSFICTFPGDDAQVPIFGLTNQRLPSPV